MNLNQISVVILVSLLASNSFANEPTNLDWESLKSLCGGQWMINEDRHHLVETREEGDDSIRSRSWMLDSCFKQILRNETYRYDSTRKKLTATVAWSNGLKWECEGEWDTEMKTLTWQAPFEAGTRSFTLHLIAPKIVEYKIVDRDKTGKIEWEYTEKRFLLTD